MSANSDFALSRQLIMGVELGISRQPMSSPLGATMDLTTSERLHYVAQATGQGMMLVGGCAKARMVLSYGHHFTVDGHDRGVWNGLYA